MKPLCIYPADSADGLLAAWAVHHALGSEVEYYAAPPGASLLYLSDHNAEHRDKLGLMKGEYFEFLPLEGRDVLVLASFDKLSPPRLDALRAMAAEARSVLVLDHHATAQADLVEIGTHPNAGRWDSWIAYCGEAPKYNLAAIFDTDRSGAGITWDYLHPSQLRSSEPRFVIREGTVKKNLNPLPTGPRPPPPRAQVAGAPLIRSMSRPRIIDLVEDRDLWRFRYGDESRAFHAVLTSYPMDDLPAMFKRLDEWNFWAEGYSSKPPGQPSADCWRGVLAEGHAILRAQAQAVRAAVTASRRTMRIAGHVVPVANVPHAMASEAGHLLCRPFSEQPETYTEEMSVDILPRHQLDIDAPVTHFTATYFDGADGRRHFFLRSPPGGADVGQVAKAMAERFNERARNISLGNIEYQPSGWMHDTSWAGGGDAHAAGFDAPIGWEGE